MAALRVLPYGRITLSRQPAEPANSKHEARQPCWSRMRRALAASASPPRTGRGWPRVPPGRGLPQRPGPDPLMPASPGSPYTAATNRVHPRHRAQLHHSRSRNSQGIFPGPKARSQDDSDRTCCHAPDRARLRFSGALLGASVVERELGQEVRAGQDAVFLGPESSSYLPRTVPNLPDDTPATGTPGGILLFVRRCWCLRDGGEW